MSRFDPLFDEALARASREDRRRVLRSVQPLDHGRVRIGGRELIDVSSNDYLGLARHPALIERAGAWARRYGAGASGSRLVRGTFEIHLAVEAKLAQAMGAPAALLFASGWQANASVLPALFALGEGPALAFTDRLMHASLHHGCKAAGVREIRFRHNDADHLERLLEERSGEPGRRFILTESVFSMNGDRADVARLAQIAARHDAFLYLDEAHAIGVFGPGGAGLASQSPGGADLVMGAASKGLGGFGAFAAGSQSLIDYLVNACSGFIYSTALPPAVLGALDAALDLIPAMDAERAHLLALSGRLRDGLTAQGIDILGSTSQIVPAVVGEASAALALARGLEAEGVLAVAIRPPTVPKGSSRIRFALSAAHSMADVDRVVDLVSRRWPARQPA